MPTAKDITTLIKRRFSLYRLLNWLILQLEAKRNSSHCINIRCTVGNGGFSPSSPPLSTRNVELFLNSGTGCGHHVYRYPEPLSTEYIKTFEFLWQTLNEGASYFFVLITLETKQRDKFRLKANTGCLTFKKSIQSKSCKTFVINLLHNCFICASDRCWIYIKLKQTQSNPVRVIFMSLSFFQQTRHQNKKQRNKNYEVDATNS